MRRAVILVALLHAACARAPTPTPQPAPVDRSTWEGDARVYDMLLAFPLTPAQHDSIDAYIRRDGARALLQIVIAAEDGNAPSTVRANALLALARARADMYLGTFRDALDDPDPRIRATAVAAMREFLEVKAEAAQQIARIALGDPVAEVQAQALQLLGEGDVAALRSYLRGSPAPELANIARDLIAAAEERGAPLQRDSATGVLRRVSAHGRTIEFIPAARWDRWDAALGRVSIGSADGRTVATIDSIEVVGGVVPVFFSPDGTSIVYERQRDVFVRDLTTQQTRRLGAGIAPRPRPFTEEFIFLREQENGRVEQRERTLIRYDVLRAPFRGEVAPQSIGVISAMTSFAQRGGYSSARWARVQQRGDTFYLTADNMEELALPSPFGGIDR
jgi:hypothetical protein